MKSSLRVLSVAAMILLVLTLGLPAFATKPSKPGPSPSPSPSPSADISLSVIDSADPVLRAEEITYVVTVANAGPSSASVTVETVLSGAIQISITPSQGSCSTSTRCQLGSVLSGGSSRVTVVGRVTSLESVALQADAWGNQADPNSSNNRETEVTMVMSGTGTCGSLVTPYDSSGMCTFTSAGGPITATGAAAGSPVEFMCSPGVYCPILRWTGLPWMQVSVEDPSGRILATCQGGSGCTASSSETVPAGTVLTCRAAVWSSSFIYALSGAFACTG